MRRSPFKLDGAACSGHENPELFMQRSTFHSARKICSICPVRAACYLTALAEGNCGTWGGVWIDRHSVGHKWRHRNKYLRVTALEARMFLLETYGILVKESENIERELKQIARRLTR